MSKLVRLSFALMTAILLFGAKLDAAKPATKPTPKTVSSKPATKPVKATQSKPITTKTTKAVKPVKTTTTAKAPKSSSPKSSSTKLAKTTNAKKSTTTTASTTSSTTVGSTTSTDTTTVPVGPEMNSKLQKKLGEDSQHATRLAAKLNLPEGITIQQAAAGFKNWGQFNAAVNLSTSKGIPFNDLKAAMTGWTLPNVLTGDATKTTTGTMSLGQAQKAFSSGTLPTYPSPGATPTTTTTQQ
jgi:hypothetical protein